MKFKDIKGLESGVNLTAFDQWRCVVCDISSTALGAPAFVYPNLCVACDKDSATKYTCMLCGFVGHKVNFPFTNACNKCSTSHRMPDGATNYYHPIPYTDPGSKKLKDALGGVAHHTKENGALIADNRRLAKENDDLKFHLRCLNQDELGKGIKLDLCGRCLKPGCSGYCQPVVYLDQEID